MIQPHTFDATKFASSRLRLPSSPAQHPSMDHIPGPQLSAQTGRTLEAGPLLSRQNQQDASAQNERLEREGVRPNVYERIFGKYRFGSGKYLTKKTFGGWFGSKKTMGIENQMSAFQRDRSRKGKNMPDSQKKVLDEEFEKTLGGLPTYLSYDGKDESIPRLPQKQLKRRLYRDWKQGRINHATYMDGLNIIKNIKV